MYSTMNIVNNIVYLQITKGVNFESSHHKEKIITVNGDRC